MTQKVKCFASAVNLKAEKRDQGDNHRSSRRPDYTRKLEELEASTSQAMEDKEK